VWVRRVARGNVCHLCDEPTNRRLLARAARWLVPGGRLVILDFLADDERLPISAALYELSLAGRSVTGGLHSGADYQRWLADAGCTRVERVPLTDFSSITLVSGSRKP
jgi:hypothetical protein